jgi:hypothetical protein
MPKTKESTLLAIKKYKLKNADKVKSYAKEYYQKNRDAILQKKREQSERPHLKKQLDFMLLEIERLKTELTAKDAPLVPV